MTTAEEDALPRQPVTVMPTFVFNADGGMTVGLPDIGSDDLHVRSIVSRLADNIQDALIKEWAATVRQACDLFDDKKPAEAAKMLVDLGWFLPQIPYDYSLVQRVSCVARHRRVNVDHQLRLLTSVVLLYQRAKEYVLAREAAHELYDLSLAKEHFNYAANALTTIAHCQAQEGQIQGHLVLEREAEQGESRPGLGRIVAAGSGNIGGARAAQQTNHGTAQGRQRLGNGRRAHLGAIFIKRDIADPVALGFDVPMLPHILQSMIGRGLLRGEVGHAIDRFGAALTGSLGDDPPLDREDLL